MDHKPALDTLTRHEMDPGVESVYSLGVTLEFRGSAMDTMLNDSRQRTALLRDVARALAISPHRVELKEGGIGDVKAPQAAAQKTAAASAGTVRLVVREGAPCVAAVARAMPLLTGWSLAGLECAGVREMGWLTRSGQPASRAGPPSHRAETSVGPQKSSDGVRAVSSGGHGVSEVYPTPATQQRLRNVGWVHWPPDAELLCGSLRLHITLPQDDLRAAFETFLCQDIARSLNVPPKAVRVMAIESNPTTVYFQVSLRDTGPERHPKDLASDFVIQAQDPDSPLSAGKVTQYIDHSHVPELRIGNKAQLDISRVGVEGGGAAHLEATKRLWASTPPPLSTAAPQGQGSLDPQQKHYVELPMPKTQPYRTGETLQGKKLPQLPDPTSDSILVNNRVVYRGEHDNVETV